jgi:hypothetical protein
MWSEDQDPLEAREECTAEALMPTYVTQQPFVPAMNAAGHTCID